MKTKFLLFVCIGFIAACAPSQEQNDTSIFNGENLQGWQVPENNIWWSVEDGLLVAKSDTAQAGSILWTEKSYKNFVVQADFKMGEGTVDSGIFIRSEDHQIQIGESGSLKRDMTASPYVPGKGYPVEAEGVQGLLKKDDWNTLKVRADGAKLTAWLNGKEVMNYTVENAPETGAIGLQLHPNRDMDIAFKHISVEEI